MMDREMLQKYASLANEYAAAFADFYAWWWNENAASCVITTVLWVFLALVWLHVSCSLFLGSWRRLAAWCRYKPARQGPDTSAALIGFLESFVASHREQLVQLAALNNARVEQLTTLLASQGLHAQERLNSVIQQSTAHTYELNKLFATNTMQHMVNMFNCYEKLNENSSKAQAHAMQIASNSTPSSDALNNLARDSADRVQAFANGSLEAVRASTDVAIAAINDNSKALMQLLESKKPKDDDDDDDDDDD